MRAHQAINMREKPSTLRRQGGVGYPGDLEIIFNFPTEPAKKSGDFTLTISQLYKSLFKPSGKPVFGTSTKPAPKLTREEFEAYMERVKHNKFPKAPQ